MFSLLLGGGSVPASPDVPPRPVTDGVVPVLVAEELPDPQSCPAEYLERRVDYLEELLRNKRRNESDKAKSDITFNVNGRVYLDSYNVAAQRGADPRTEPSNHRFSELKNWAGFRSLRLDMSGEIYDRFDYRINIGYIAATVPGNAAGVTGNRSGVSAQTIFFAAKDLPILDYLKIGNFTVEDGFSVMSAGYNMAFMSSPSPSTDFHFTRRPGIASRHHWKDDCLRHFIGIFIDESYVTTERQVQQDNLGMHLNTRLTYIPHVTRDEDGKKNWRDFQFFGVNYNYVDNSPDKVIPIVTRFGEFLLGTAFDVDVRAPQYHRFGIEAIVQQGPFAAQCEWYAHYFGDAAVQSGERLSRRQSRVFWGGYFETRYFLTGDHRRFNTGQATWGHAVLKQDLDLRKRSGVNRSYGWGAWEIAARWGYSDASAFWEAAAPAIVGATHDLTFGLNWYWSYQVRWMLNYSRILPAQIRDGMPRDHSATDVVAVALRLYF